MRKIAAILIIFLVNLNCYSQNTIEDLKFLILSSKYKDAFELSNRLIQENPDEAEIYFHQALINKLLFRYSDANISIKMAIQKDSSNVDYLAEYGFILMKLEKEKEAQKIFEEVIKRNPYHINSGITLSNMYLKEKKDEKTELAEKILLDLYEKDSINGFLARSIGLCGFKLGNSKKSIKWLSRAIQLDNTDIKAYRFLFSVYVAKEEFDLAFEVFNQAIRFDPENKELFIMAGDLHVIRNHHYRAIKEYEKAYELDKSDADLAGKLGISYYKIEKYEKAKNYLLIPASNPFYESLEIYKHLGYIYKKYNQPDSSTFFFSKALDLLRPDNNSIFELKRDIAENHLTLNNYNHTIGLYKSALKLDLYGIWSISYKNQMLIDLAFVYADKLNDKKTAIEYLEKVTNDSKIFFSDRDYYKYAQQQITLFKEDLFMEGD